MWYQEPRLTFDPELGALSPLCMDLYTLQAVRKSNGYETDSFLQGQTMHVAVPQCMLGMSVVLVHDGNREMASNLE